MADAYSSYEYQEQRAACSAAEATVARRDRTITALRSRIKKLEAVAKVAKHVISLYETEEEFTAAQGLYLIEDALAALGE